MPILFHVSRDYGRRDIREVAVNLYWNVNEYFRRYADWLGLDAGPLVEVDPYALNKLTDEHRERLCGLLVSLQTRLQDAYLQPELDPEIEAPSAMGYDEAPGGEEAACGREGILSLLDRLIGLCRRAGVERDVLVARGD